MKNCYFLILFALLGCENLNFSLVNQGTVVGDNVGNKSDAEVHQEAGDRPLTKEEIERATKGYQRGRDEILNPQASLGLIDGAFNIQWESDITRGEFFKKFPKLNPVHRDLVTLLHLMYKKAPEFKLFQCARDLEQQKRNVARGVSQTMKSKHLMIPTQACDIRSARKAKPRVNDKVDIYDVEFLGYMQGLAEGFGMGMSLFPCEAFASIVRRVMRWKTIRDLFHIELWKPKPECADGYRTKFNKFGWQGRGELNTNFQNQSLAIYH